MFHVGIFTLKPTDWNKETRESRRQSPQLKKEKVDFYLYTYEMSTYELMYLYRVILN